MRLRLLELEFLDNPRMSLAVEEAIFRLMLLGKSPPTFGSGGIGMRSLLENSR